MQPGCLGERCPERGNSCHPSPGEGAEAPEAGEPGWLGTCGPWGGSSLAAGVWKHQLPPTFPRGHENELSTTAPWPREERSAGRQMLPLPATRPGGSSAGPARTCHQVSHEATCSGHRLRPSPGPPCVTNGQSASPEDRAVLAGPGGRHWKRGDGAEGRQGGGCTTRR